METNAVKSVGWDKPIIDIANNTEIKKPEQKQENISELLAGNNDDKKTEKSDNPKNGMSKKDIILNSIAITYSALFLFILTKPGEKFVNKLIRNFIFKK